MRVLYVWDADYPWDVRTEKICLALTNAGMDVIIAARNLRGAAPSEPMPEGRVERLPVLPKWTRRALTFPAFFNPVWVYHLRRLCEREGCDLVIVRDLPLAPTALLVAGSKVPVVLDMAENYPAMIADVWRDGRTRPLDFVVRQPRVVAHIERAVLKRMTHTLTVVEESRERLIRMGVPPDRLSVVSNTPSRLRVGRAPSQGPASPLKVVYLGLMEFHRGVGDLIAACSQLASEGFPFTVDMVGDGRDLHAFVTQAGELARCGGPVTFHGRLPHADALRVVAAAHVGVVPHHATEAWATTIPNKLFDYMAAGLSVVTSDAPPAARVVRATASGLVFRSGDSKDLASQIRAMQDSVARDRFSRAGQDAIRTSYNWELDSQRLVETIQRVRLTFAPATAKSSRLPASSTQSR